MTRRTHFNTELLKFNAALERFKKKNGSELLVLTEIQEQKIKEMWEEIKWLRGEVRRLKRLVDNIK